MAPLLRKHLMESESVFPTSVRRSLNILFKRHQKQAQVRLRVLREVLALFQQEQLTPMLIKGAALCQTLYPDPALRPMRDMDILFSENEVDQAQDVLRAFGFLQSSAPIPPDHHHLPSLHKTVDDVKICFELHRGLYPNCPPYYPDVDFERLLKSAKTFHIDDVEAITFSDEETVHYLYQHAFRAPLTYESYKLINVADIIGFTEKHYQALDWQQIKMRFPLLKKALPLMHHISPWDFDKIPVDFFSVRDREQRLEPLTFSGWPSKRRKELRAEGRKLHRILLDTFLPPMWWVGVFYGATTRRGCLLCTFWRHPRHIYWWVRLYSRLPKS